MQAPGDICMFTKLLTNCKNFALGQRFVIVIPETPRGTRQFDLVKVIGTQSDTLFSIPIHNTTFRITKAGDFMNVELTERDYALFLYSNKPVKVFLITKSAKVCVKRDCCLQA